jgi:hypothetical protein
MLVHASLSNVFSARSGAWDLGFTASQLRWRVLLPRALSAPDLRVVTRDSKLARVLSPENSTSCGTILAVIQALHWLEYGVGLKYTSLMRLVGSRCEMYSYRDALRCLDGYQ